MRSNEDGSQVFDRIHHRRQDDAKQAQYEETTAKQLPRVGSNLLNFEFCQILFQFEFKLCHFGLSQNDFDAQNVVSQWYSETYFAYEQIIDGL